MATYHSAPSLTAKESCKKDYEALQHLVARLLLCNKGRGLKELSIFVDESGDYGVQSDCCICDVGK